MHLNTDFIYKYSQSLKIPAFCYRSLAHANSMLDLAAYTYALNKIGILIINLEYQDPDGATMQNIVNAIGTPHTHDGLDRTVWDIKLGGVHGSESLARSHKLDEFILHTDCSYEANVPDFFGLYVISSDNLGGGKNLIIDGSTLIQHLSSSALKVLQSETVKIIVPLEFRKNIEYIYAHVIDENFNMRYRRELMDLSTASDDFMLALDELERLCHSPALNRTLELPKDAILFLDNKRYLHARTTIKDPSRHLKRIRFFAAFHKLV